MAMAQCSRRTAGSRRSTAATGRNCLKLSYNSRKLEPDSSKTARNSIALGWEIGYDYNRTIGILMAAMVLCLSMEMPGVMTAKAAECEAMSARAWSHCGCGVELVVSVGHRCRIESKVRCTGYNHGPNCWICSGEFWDVYVITCPRCNISQDQNIIRSEHKDGVHLDFY